MDLAADARESLKRLKASPLKKLGQNFMVDDASLRTISEAVNAKPSETVLEIGPGLGFLTRYLIERGAAVVAVEKDPAMTRYLTEHFPERLRVIEKDILEFDPAPVFTSPVKAVGNIPYNITSPILEWLVVNKRFFSEAYLTVQWEVAQRLGAGPGGKTWGSLSVFLQMNADVTLLQKIPSSKFYPPPKVDSALVKMVFLPKGRFELKNEDFFFAMVRRSFQKRRKTILNALKEEMPGPFEKNALLEAFKKCGIDPGRRSETLSLSEWAVLARSLCP